MKKNFLGGHPDRTRVIRVQTQSLTFIPTSDVSERLIKEPGDSASKCRGCKIIFWEFVIDVINRAGRAPHSLLVVLHLA